MSKKTKIRLELRNYTLNFLVSVTTEKGAKLDELLRDWQASEQSKNLSLLEEVLKP